MIDLRDVITADDFGAGLVGKHTVHLVSLQDDRLFCHQWQLTGYTTVPLNDFFLATDSQCQRCLAKARKLVKEKP